MIAVWKQKKHSKLERDFHRQRKRKKPREPNELELRLQKSTNQSLPVCEDGHKDA